jgi:hypothetical protein
LALHGENTHLKSQFSREKEGTDDVGATPQVKTPVIIRRRNGNADSVGVLGTPNKKGNLNDERREQDAHLLQQTGVSSSKLQSAKPMKRGLSVSPKSALKDLKEMSADFSDEDDRVQKSLRSHIGHRRGSQSRQLVPRNPSNLLKATTISNTLANRVTTDANGVPVPSAALRQSLLNSPHSVQNGKTQTTGRW